jgi:hypothetical protein
VLTKHGITIFLVINSRGLFLHQGVVAKPMQPTQHSGLILIAAATRDRAAMRRWLAENRSELVTS